MVSLSHSSFAPGSRYDGPALDHRDKSEENLIKILRIPYIVERLERYTQDFGSTQNWQFAEAVQLSFGFDAGAGWDTELYKKFMPPHIVTSMLTHMRIVAEAHEVKIPQPILIKDFNRANVNIDMINEVIDRVAADEIERQDTLDLIYGF